MCSRYARIASRHGRSEAVGVADLPGLVCWARAASCRSQAPASSGSRWDRSGPWPGAPARSQFSVRKWAARRASISPYRVSRLYSRTYRPIFARRSAKSVPVDSALWAAMSAMAPRHRASDRSRSPGPATACPREMRRARMHWFPSISPVSGGIGRLDGSPGVSGMAARTGGGASPSSMAACWQYRAARCS